MCYKESIDKECWEIIVKALKALKEISKQWDNIAKGIMNTPEGNEYIDQALSELEKGEKPERYELDRIIANLAKLKMKQSIKNIAIYAVKNSVGDTNEIQKYIKDPQLAIEKYSNAAY